jgi:hypothetical protein
VLAAYLVSHAVTAYGVVLVVLLLALSMLVMRPHWLLVPFLPLALLLPSFRVVDVASLLLIGAAGLALYFRGRHLALLRNEFVAPLLALASVVGLAMFWGVFVRQNTAGGIYTDSRPFFYWLMLIPFLGWPPAGREHKWLLRLAVFTGLVVAGLAILQSVMGISLLGAAKLEEIDTEQGASSFKRVQIAGYMFVMFAFCYLASQLFSAGRLMGLRLLALLALGIGLIISYGRAIWFWETVALLITAAFYGRRTFWRLALALAVSGALAFAALSLALPDLVQGVIARLTSVTDEGGSRTSLGWRLQENHFAWKTLISSGFMGIGLGSEYRPPVVALLQLFANHTRYIHNGHLYVAVKLGVVGLLVYYWLFWRMFSAAKRLWTESRHSEPFLPATCGFLVAFLGINSTQPELMGHDGLLIVVLLCAALIAYRRARGAAAQTPSSTPTPAHPGAEAP